MDYCILFICIVLWSYIVDWYTSFVVLNDKVKVDIDLMIHVWFCVYMFRMWLDDVFWLRGVCICTSSMPFVSLSSFMFIISKIILSDQYVFEIELRFCNWFKGHISSLVFICLSVLMFLLLYVVDENLWHYFRGGREATKCTSRRKKSEGSWWYWEFCKSCWGREAQESDQDQ